jgi:segregation and condensation protein B
MNKAAFSVPPTATMSLKAKIEAVIYAAEEPVTLAQLAAIFAGEVPSAEQPAAEQLEVPFVAESAGAPESVTTEITVIDEAGTMSDFFTETVPDHQSAHHAAHAAALDTAPLLAEQGVPDSSRDPLPESAISQRPESDALVDRELAAKRAARLRDRAARDHIRVLVDELIADYVVQDRGIEIREIAGGYRMATKPEYHDAVRAFVKSLKPVMKLSLQALETLAVIAYKQPVTAPEVAEIRGVDSGGVLASLISRKLVTTAGRKQVIGRPILYKTTKEFLVRFGLKDVAELPSMEEFEKMAGELAESDAIEAEAMHEKAGIEPEHEGSEPLPFEHAGQDTAAEGEPPQTEADSQLSTDPDASQKLSAQPEPSEVERPVSSSQGPSEAPAHTNETASATEEVAQEQES